MKRLPVALLLLLLATSPALGQATPSRSITLDEITADDAPPPPALARLFDAPVDGVLGSIEVCYAERLRARPDVAGTERLRLWVSAQQIIRVTPEGSTLGDPELELCVKNALLAYRLPPETPRGGVRVRFRLTFTPPPSGQALVCADGHCELAACGGDGQPCCGGGACTAGACTENVCRVPPRPSVVARVTRASGGLTADELGAALASDVLAACGTGPEGELPVSLSIARTGRVRATPGRGTLTDRTTIACLRSALNGMALPARPRATSARVTITVATPR